MGTNEDPKRAEGPATAKTAAAIAALGLIAEGSVIGVGSGSTAAAFVEALGSWSGPRPVAAVASSLDTSRLLRAIGVDVTPLPPSGHIPLYVDGADGVDGLFRLLKGRGGAHTREKVLASAAEIFVCVIDDTKTVDSFAGCEVPVEYLPMARAFVAREIEGLGGVADHRPGFVTDNGNELFDVSGLDLSDPGYMEGRLEEIPGVVSCGIFAQRSPDVVIVGHTDGTSEILRLPESTG
jgi:ribose 5-phosphate isomerase A